MDFSKVPAALLFTKMEKESVLVHWGDPVLCNTKVFTKEEDMLEGMCLDPANAFSISALKYIAPTF